MKISRFTHSPVEIGQQLSRRKALQLASAAVLYPVAYPILQAAQVSSATAAGGVMHGRLAPAPALTATGKQVADDLAAKIKHAFAAAASSPPDEVFPAGSYAAIAQKYLSHQKPQSRAQARQKASALLNAPVPERQRVFGSFANVDPAIHKSAVEVVDNDTAAKLGTVIKERAVIHIELDNVLKTEEKKRPRIKLGPTYRKLGFFIHRVKCLEETDEIGSDEILMAGFGITPSGKLIQVPSWKVSDDFDQGESVPYSPPRKVVEFDLFAPGEFPWPRIYTVSLIMGEEDSGGFGDFLDGVWGKVGKDVKDAAGEAVGKEAGEYVGKSFGDIIGEIAGEVIGAIIGWLVNLFDNPDDPIGTRTWTLGLLSPFKAYYDSLPNVVNGAAPNGVMHFKGDGGRYDVTLQWKVYN